MINYIEEIKSTGVYKKCIPLIEKEYEALVKALSHESYDLIDALRQSKLGGSGTFNPNTFAEWFEIKGHRFPEEPYLHNHEDLCSGQCLDYIFELKMMGHNPSKNIIINKTRV